MPWPKGVSQPESTKKILSLKFRGKGNPFYGKKHNNKMKKYISKRTKEGMTTDIKKKMSLVKLASQHHHTAEWKTIASLRMKKEKGSLKNRKKVSIFMKSWWNIPGKRENIGSIVKKRWENPEYKNRTLKKILKRSQNSPNKFETRALLHINSLSRKTFKFCGDGSVLINGRSPDAINKRAKIVCLFNGVYWHLLKRGLSICDKNKRKRERIEARPFLEKGYVVWFVWEDELK